MLSNDICGSGLKDRVTACRKRLRDNRVAQRTKADGDSAQLFANRASEVRLHYLSPDAASARTENETLLSVGEEVGIT
jgi:hypothetical protein